MSVKRGRELELDFIRVISMFYDYLLPYLC